MWVYLSAKHDWSKSSKQDDWRKKQTITEKDVNAKWKETVKIIELI